MYHSPGEESEKSEKMSLKGLKEATTTNIAALTTHVHGCHCYDKASWDKVPMSTNVTVVEKNTTTCSR